MSDTPCKPVILQPLRDVNINEGETLKLHAAINAHPEPEVNESVVFFPTKMRYRSIGFSILDHLVSKRYSIKKFSRSFD